MPEAISRSDKQEGTADNIPVLFCLLPIPLNPPFCKGGVMFYDADYPDDVSLGFQEADRPVVILSVLPTP